MQDPATLSKRQLLELLEQKSNELTESEKQLVGREKQILVKDDIIQQLEAKIDA